MTQHGVGHHHLMPTSILLTPQLHSFALNHEFFTTATFAQRIAVLWASYRITRASEVSEITSSTHTDRRIRTSSLPGRHESKLSGW